MKEEEDDERDDEEEEPTILFLYLHGQAIDIIIYKNIFNFNFFNLLNEFFSKSFEFLFTHCFSTFSTDSSITRYSE